MYWTLHTNTQIHTGVATKTSDLFLDRGEDGGGGFRLRAVSIGGIEDGAQHGSSAGRVRCHLRHWHTSWKKSKNRRLLILSKILRHVHIKSEMLLHPQPLWPMFLYVDVGMRCWEAHSCSPCAQMSCYFMKQTGEDQFLCHFLLHDAKLGWKAVYTRKLNNTSLIWSCDLTVFSKFEWLENIFSD